MIAKVEVLDSKRRFPVARKHKYGGYVVIFTEDRRGMVVAAGDDCTFKVGFQKADWISCEDSDTWLPVEVTIVG